MHKHEQDTDPVECLILTAFLLNVSMENFLQAKGGEEHLSEAEGKLMEDLCVIAYNLATIATTLVAATGVDVSSLSTLPTPPTWKDVKTFHENAG